MKIEYPIVIEPGSSVLGIVTDSPFEVNEKDIYLIENENSDNPILHISVSFYIVADNAVVNFRDIHLTYIPLSNKAYESEEDIIHNKKVVKKTELNFLARFGKRIAYHNNIGPYQSM